MVYVLHNEAYNAFLSFNSVLNTDISCSSLI